MLNKVIIKRGKREARWITVRPTRQYMTPISEKQAMIANGIFRKDI